MVQSDKTEHIPAFPLGMNTEVGIFTDKSTNNIKVIHFVVDGDITIEDASGATKTFSFNQGRDMAISPEVVSFSTTGEVIIG